MTKITIIKVLFIGLLTTMSRIIAQLLIPATSTSILPPSVFVLNKTMELAFSMYGIVAYSLIASVYVLIKQYVKPMHYAVSCCVLWTIYLMEPLPHVALIDVIVYPLADSFALLVMGFLLSKLFHHSVDINQKIQVSLPYLIISTVFFVVGRSIQYSVFSIYSSWNNYRILTIVWSVVAGVIVSLVLWWYHQLLSQKSMMYRIVVLYILFFGGNMVLFNFFMPLVFSVDCFDLILRTIMDVIFMMIGYGFYRFYYQSSLN